MSKQLYFSIFTLLLSLFLVENMVAQPCYFNNATNCKCPDGSEVCDLLPDAKVAAILLSDTTMNPEKRGELRISISTPNVGYGPLHINATNQYLCGTDTIEVIGEPAVCPDGIKPLLLVEQFILQKNGDEASILKRPAGGMTYHPTHSHMHLNAWCDFSLREKTADPDPLTWPILASGDKLGFCLINSGSCDSYEGHCVDNDDKVLYNDDFINYVFNPVGNTCGSDFQEIAVGHTDIYEYALDGMELPIPNTVCDGEYYLVVTVDPLDYIKEVDENNNTVAVPFTLSKQNYKADEILLVDGQTTICKGDSLRLSSIPFATGYEWSNGEKTQIIYAKESGTYSVHTETFCGPLTSKSVEVTVIETDAIAVNTSDTTCAPSPVIFTAQNPMGSSQIIWYNTPNLTSEVARGATFETEMLDEAKDFYVVQEQFFEGETFFNEPHDNSFGNSNVGNPAFNGYLVFDAQVDFTLISVKVYAESAGERQIVLRDTSGAILQEKTVDIPIGESRVILNFEVPQGPNYELASPIFPYLERTNTNVKFPYQVDNIVKIKKSNFDDEVGSFFYYYYFYDWEIKEKGFACQSEVTKITAPIKNCVGISDDEFLKITNKSISIQPNPNKGDFNIIFAPYLAENSQENWSKITIFNLTGQAIFQEKLSNEPLYLKPKHRLQLPKNLNSGIYLLQITLDKSILYHKIVIE